MRRALTSRPSRGKRPDATVLWPLALGLALLAVCDEARAQGAPTGAACVASNEQAGPLRRAGKLREARSALRLCSAPTCPAAVQKDCIAGAAQIDADVPTIAFSVQDGSGNDLGAVKISLDGEVIVSKLDGKAIEVDPGEHTFKFESAGQPTVEKRIVVVEGEKNRRERVVLGELKSTAPPAETPPKLTVVLAPPEKASTQKTVGYIVGGGGLLVGAVGSVFGLVAALQWRSAKTACGANFPTSCTSSDGSMTAMSDQTSANRAATLADVLLGVGGAGIVTGVVLLLTAPVPVPTAKVQGGLSVTPTVGPSGGGLLLGGRF